ncbi:thioredoxin family protein [Motiliproteus sp.]|uniref:thioredoxin family protein n=1 Tax=Motiliproteus sp. TaxID=1898955 RepID=UPI003BA8C6F6
MKRLTPNDDFESIAKEKDWALVYFSATWCGPCQTMGPIVERLAADYEQSLTTFKADVDEVPELAGRYGLRGVPTLLLLKQGRVVDGQVGAMPGTMLANWINEKRKQEHE